MRTARLPAPRFLHLSRKHRLSLATLLFALLTVTVFVLLRRRHHGISIELKPHDGILHLVETCAKEPLWAMDESQQPSNFMNSFPQVPLGAILASFVTDNIKVLRYWAKPIDEWSSKTAFAGPFDIWVQCGLNREHRLLPTTPISNSQSIILFLPGHAVYGSKRGLYDGFLERHGAETTHLYLPQTWFKSRNGEHELLQYAATHLSTRFIAKRGHRQGHVMVYTGQEIVDLAARKGISPGAALRAAVDGVQEENAIWLPDGIYQVMQDTFMVDDRRTAFRTYVWVSCIDEQRQAVAVVDYHAPAYHAVNESSIFASGYSGKKTFQDTSTFLREFLSKSQAHDVRQCVKTVVKLFLEAFSKLACEGREASNQGLVAEVHGFDWIAVPRQVEHNHGGDLHCKLLETNRFPDMSLTDFSNPIPKDCLKICTFARRLKIAAVKTSKSSPVTCYCEDDVDEDFVD